MPKPVPLKDVKFREMPGTIENNLPSIYQELNIASGIDANARRIRKNDKGGLDLPKTADGNVRRIYVYEPGSEIPYAAEIRGGKLCLSKQPVAIGAVLSDADFEPVKPYEEVKTLEDKDINLDEVLKDEPDNIINEPDNNINNINDINEPEGSVLSGSSVSENVSWEVQTPYLFEQLRFAFPPPLDPDQQVSFRGPDGKPLEDPLVDYELNKSGNRLFLFPEGDAEEDSKPYVVEYRDGKVFVSEEPVEDYVSYLNTTDILEQIEQGEPIEAEAPKPTLASFRSIEEGEASERRMKAIQDAYGIGAHLTFFTPDGKILSEKDAQDALKDKDVQLLVSAGNDLPRMAVIRNDHVYLSDPISPKIDFKDDDFKELGAFGDKNTINKLELPETAYAVNGEGTFFRMNEKMPELPEDVPPLPIPKSRPPKERMLDYVSDGKKRLLIYEKPGAQPFLLESRVPAGQAVKPKDPDNITREELAAARKAENDRRARGIIRITKTPLKAEYTADEKSFKPIETMMLLQENFPDEFGFAMSPEGRTFGTLEEAATELEKPGAVLFLYNKDYDLPYAVRRSTDGSNLWISDEPVSTLNQTRTNDLHKIYKPKKSFAVNDIITAADKREYNILVDLYDDLSKWARKTGDKTQAEIMVARQEQEISAHRAVQPQLGDRPARPQFSTLSSIWRGIVKTISLGFAETAGYKAYQEAVRTYENETLPAFEAQEIQYQKDMIPWNKKMEKLQSSLSFYQKKQDMVETQLPQLKDEIAEKKQKWQDAAEDNDAATVQQYRRNPEVLAEGVSDYMKNGLTQDNLFAYTKLTEMSCSGKSAKDPEAVEALYEYVAARNADDAITKEIADEGIKSSGKYDRMVEQVRNGQAVAELKKDPIFQTELQKLERQGAKINPPTFFNQYCYLVYQKKKILPSNRDAAELLRSDLKKIREDFGKKPIGKEALHELMRETAYKREYQLKTSKNGYNPGHASKFADSLRGDAVETNKYVLDSGQYPADMEGVLKKMRELEAETCKRMDVLEDSITDEVAKQSLRKAQNWSYKTSMEEIPADPEHPEIAKVITKTPYGEKTEQIQPDDPRLKNGTFEPGKSYLITKEAVYNFEGMKTLFEGGRQKYLDEQAKLQEKQQAEKKEGIQGPHIG